MARRVTEAGTYIKVWAAVMLLAGLSWLLSTVSLGPFSAPIALAIAVAKTLLIAAFFMHLVEQPSISRWAFGFGIGLLVLLVVLVAIDELTRQRYGITQPGLESGVHRSINPGPPAARSRTRPEAPA